MNPRSLNPRETFLGFDVFEKRHTGNEAMFSRVVGYRAERRTERSEKLEARTLRELRAMIRGLVAARRTGVIR